MNTLAVIPKYKTYKISNVDWLDDIPISWNEKKLKFISYIDNSGEFGVDPELKALNYPVATTAQITSDGIFLVEKMPIRGFSPEKASRYLCKAGDILVVKSSGSITNVISGKVGIVSDNTEPFIFSNFLLRIRSKQNKVVARYIYYLLTSNLTKERVNRMVTGSTYPNLQVPEYISALMPLPPFKEQTAITNFLDQKTAQLDQAIAIKEKQITLLKERKQILIQKAVTRGLDPNVPMKDSGVEWIGEIPAHWSVLPNFSLFTERVEPGQDGLPLLSVSIHSGVSTEEIDEEENIRGRVKIQDKTKYNLVKPHDIVFNMMRAWQGGIGAVSVEGMVSPAYIIAAPNNKINTQYLEHQYRSPIFVQQMDRFSKGITDFRKRLYWDEFKRLNTITPPIREQAAIVTHINTESRKTNKAIALLQQQIEKLKEYKTTLINSAVTGKIKVINQNIEGL